MKVSKSRYVVPSGISFTSFFFFFPPFTAWLGSSLLDESSVARDFSCSRISSKSNLWNSGFASASFHLYSTFQSIAEFQSACDTSPLSPSASHRRCALKGKKGCVKIARYLDKRQPKDNFDIDCAAPSPSKSLRYFHGVADCSI